MRLHRCGRIYRKLYFVAGAKGVSALSGLRSASALAAAPAARGSSPTGTVGRPAPYGAQRPTAQATPSVISPACGMKFLHLGPLAAL